MVYSVTNRVRQSKLGALSLRTQLVMLTGFLLALAIAVTSLVAISALRGQLVQQIDTEMKSSSSSLTKYLGNDKAVSSNGPGFRYSAYLMDSDGNLVSSIVADDGNSSPRLNGWNHENGMRYNGQGLTVPSNNGDTEWRILPLATDDSGYTVIIATPLTQTNAVVTLVGLLTLAFGLATLAAAAALAWVLVTRAFEPLTRVERTAARIAAGDLSQRIERHDPRTEIGQLSLSLNVMLTRIEEAFDAQKRSEVKMRRFVGDASHELRTPLVSIRGYSELYRHGALQTDEDVAKAMSRIEAESKRMGQLVEDLLMLARIDERRAMEMTQVDLLNLANDAAGDAAASAPEREIAVVGLESGPGLPAPVLGDEPRLRQVLANLVTNALRYTPEGTPIEIAVGSRPGIDGQFLSVVKVVDHGPGIQGDEMQKVFERFYRSDESRARDTGGTGLGLAIVAAIIAQHNGSVRVEESPGGGATMVVQVPQHAPDAEDGSAHPQTGEIPS